MIKWKPTATFAVMACLSLFLAASVTSSVAAAPPFGGMDQERTALIAPEPLITAPPEMQYVSVTPCRIVDTRNGGTPLNSGTVRSYWVTGALGFGPQGGKSGGCGIPVRAKAITGSFTAVNPGGGGYIRAWAAGGSEPQATLLNYAGVSTGTGVTVEIRSGQGVGLTVKNYGGPTDLVIDVTGYYIPQLQAYIQPNGTITSQSGRLLNVSHIPASGIYNLTWDRDVSTCSVQANADLSAHFISIRNTGSVSRVRVYNVAGELSSYYFFISVHC